MFLVPPSVPIYFTLGNNRNALHLPGLWCGVCPLKQQHPRAYVPAFAYTIEIWFPCSSVGARVRRHASAASTTQRFLPPPSPFPNALSQFPKKNYSVAGQLSVRCSCLWPQLTGGAELSSLGARHRECSSSTIRRYVVGKSIRCQRGAFGTRDLSSHRHRSTIVSGTRPACE